MRHMIVKLIKPFSWTTDLNDFEVPRDTVLRVVEVWYGTRKYKCELANGVQILIPFSHAEEAPNYMLYVKK